MKLSKFPYLVQKEILSHLTYNNLFFLSLCSQKIKNFLVESQKKQFKNIEQIAYTAFWNRMEITAEIGSKTFLILDLNMSSDQRNKLTGDISGTSIDYRRPSDPEKENLSVIACSCQNFCIVKAIHNQILKLFGTNISYGMTQRPQCKLLPKLQNFQALRLHGDELYPDQFERFLEGSPNLHYFRCDVKIEDVRDLRDETKRKIYNIETVDIENSNFLCKAVFKNFNGRQAFLKVRGITQSEIVEFLNKWKSGEGFLNLELMNIRGRFFNLNSNNVADRVGFKRINTAVTFPIIEKYKHSSSYGNPSKNGKGFRSRCYIVRETDSRVASMLLIGDRMILGVWNMTESEFLEKFA